MFIGQLLKGNKKQHKKFVIRITTHAQVSNAK